MVRMILIILIEDKKKTIHATNVYIRTILRNVDNKFRIVMMVYIVIL